jgi:hypothetical protein
MNANQQAEARLWAINRIAEVLSDLADDPDDPEQIDPQELFDQMKSAAEMILDGLNLRIINIEGNSATAVFGDD